MTDTPGYTFQPCNCGAYVGHHWSGCPSYNPNGALFACDKAGNECRTTYDAGEKSPQLEWSPHPAHEQDEVNRLRNKLERMEKRFLEIADKLSDMNMPVFAQGIRDVVEETD